MDSIDYDKTLFFTHRLACEDLIFMMQQTEDDFLAKKIERFVNSFLREPDLQKVDETREDLMYYLDHVFEKQGTETEKTEIIFS